MSDRDALEAFLGKWRARWPEWRIAEAFIPVGRREPTLAWLALRQELADAAWEGADPRPGAAKLAWWSDELRGWAQGRRRHPLGLALQRVPAPWDALADALPALAATRDAAGAPSRLAPFAAAAAACSEVVAGDAALAGRSSEAVAAALDATRAMAAGGANAAAAAAVLDAWPARPAGARADRIFAALARRRLRAFAAGNTEGSAVASPWRTLWTAWCAGRSVPRA